MGILEKLLAAALGISIIVACGSLWYADREHQQIAPLQSKIADAQQAAQQASNDRDAAIKAADAARAQLKAAQTAFAEAASAANAASSAAASARAKLQAAQSSAETAKLLTTPVPGTVWDAIYNPTGK
jgi:multidrug resistance efflux pump